MHDQETEGSYSNQKAQFFAQFLDLNLFTDPEGIDWRKGNICKEKYGNDSPIASQRRPMAICLSNYILDKWEYPDILRIVTYKIWVDIDTWKPKTSL